MTSRSTDEVLINDRATIVVRSRRARYIAKGLAVLVAALALSGIVTAHGETKVSPRSDSSLPKFAGAFVNWGADGRERTLQAWEKWLRQEPSSVVGIDFYAQSTWEDFRKLSWVPGIWKKLNPARNVVWSVPLTVKGTSLAEVAEGPSDFRGTAKGDHSSRLGNESWLHGVVRRGS
jgi:hypothetical protein